MTLIEVIQESSDLMLWKLRGQVCQPIVSQNKQFQPRHKIYKWEENLISLNFI